MRGEQVTFNASFWPRLALRGVAVFLPRRNSVCPNIRCSPAKRRLYETRLSSGRRCSRLRSGTAQFERPRRWSSGRDVALGHKCHKPEFGLSALMRLLRMGRWCHNRAYRVLWDTVRKPQADGGAALLVLGSF